MAAARAWCNCASWSSRKRRSIFSKPCSGPGRRSTTRSTPTAERQQARQLAERARSAGDAYRLALARYEGAVDYTVALDSQRRYLQARRDLAASVGRLATRYVTINKAIGNVPRDASPASAQP